mgnify:CR=1 FL=1
MSGEQFEPYKSKVYKINTIHEINNYIKKGPVIDFSKNKRILNDKGKLIKVKKESFASSVYDYTKIYFLSKLEFSNKIKFYKSILLLNFNIKYQAIRAIFRFKEILKVGWKNRDVSKCRFKEIQKYLISSGLKMLSNSVHS